MRPIAESAISATAGDGPMLVSAASVRTHGAVGDFAVPLPLAAGADAGLECCCAESFRESAAPGVVPDTGRSSLIRTAALSGGGVWKKIRARPGVDAGSVGCRTEA